jgi:HlyD family type I secretion membrane fusion protein
MAKVFSRHIGIFKRAALRDNSRGPQTAKIVILTIVGFLCSSLWLASTTTVPELTRASGELKPIGGYRQIQSSEGGVVFATYVSEGQEVQESQILAVLRSSTLRDALLDVEEELRSSETELTNKRAILEFLSAVPNSAPDLNNELRSKGLGYAASRLGIFEAQQTVQTAAVEKMKQTLAVQQKASDLTAKRVDARNAQLLRAEALQKLGLITLRALDDQRDELDQLRATQVDLEIRLSETRKNLDAAHSVIDQNKLNLQNELVAETFRLEQEIAALKVRKDALLTRHLDLEIRAPEAGVIQAVAFPNFGELIAPGETIFELLPSNSELVAEIEFDPVDIGHIVIGSTVTLKLDTFDARRYGNVLGRITSISPSLVFDPETSREYFRANVLLEQETIGIGKWERPLRAGMIATAEVITTERTAIAYLVKPVSRSLEKAFGER